MLQALCLVLKVARVWRARRTADEGANWGYTVREELQAEQSMDPRTIERALLLPYNPYFNEECRRIRGKLGLPTEGAKPGDEPRWSQSLSTGWRGKLLWAGELIEAFALPPTIAGSVAEYIRVGEPYVFTNWRPMPYVKSVDLVPREYRRAGSFYLQATLYFLTPWTTREQWESLFDELHRTLEIFADAFDQKKPRGRRAAGKSSPSFQRSLAFWKGRRAGRKARDILNEWAGAAPEDEYLSEQSVYAAHRRIEELMRPVRPVRETVDHD